MELRLSLDRDLPEFVGGETVEGTLDVEVRERCECRELAVYVGWLAKSQYASDEGAQPAVTFAGGTFEPGHRESHRFALELPKPIWSYSGQTFSLTYAVKAKADLANQADAHADAPIVVRPADGITPDEIPDPPEFVLGQPNPPVPPLSAEGSIQATRLAVRFQPGCSIVIGVFFILFSLPFLFVSMAMFGMLGSLSRDVGPWVVVPVAAWMILGVGVPLISGLAMLYTGLRPFIARWILGEVSVDIPERLVRPGETISCRVTIQPKRDVEIQGVRLILRARETVWRRTRKSRRASRRTIRSEERTLEGARSVRAGDYVELSGRVNVPAEGPYSLAAPNHWVEWHTIVHVSLRGWIDQYSEHLITVAPIAAPAEN